LRETIMELSAQFVERDDELSFITQVEGIAERRAVGESIRIVSQPGRPDAAPESATFEINLEGAFPSVLLALADLERLPTVVIVDAVFIRGGTLEAGGGTPPVMAIVRGSIAFRPERL
jgi:hypothetical protein